MNPSRLDKWIMEREGLPSLTREGLLAMQLQKLNALLARERARGGYYKHVPERLSSLEELAALPFTTAADLERDANAMLLLSQSEISRVISENTSGTSGFVKRVFYTEGDLRATVGFFAAGLGELIFPGERALIAMPFSAGGGLGALIAQAVESLGAEPVRAGVGLSYGETAALLEASGAAAYVGMPVPLLSLLRYMDGKTPLMRALVSADVLMPGVQAQTEALLGTRLFPHYGSREMALGGAVTCPMHAGMHLRENHVIAEIVDESGKPLPEGERGELVITTIGMEALPLLRYRTGDSAVYTSAPCGCGGVCGRLDGLRRMHGAGPDMAALDEAMFGVEGLLDYRAKREDGALCLEAWTQNGEADGAALLRAAEGIFPGLRLRLSCRRARADDRPAYTAKRSLL